MMNFFRIASVMIFISLTASSFATDNSSGCGPGWYIVRENSLVSSALRATTNGILFPSTTIGMTLGTSNCTKHSLVMKEKESLYYMTQNYSELQKEIAQGGGEFLDAFFTTVGCQGDQVQHFAQKMQANYGAIFSKQQKQMMNKESIGLLEVYKVILSDPQLVQACSLVQS
ncbi:MAG: DUF3015 family protein [Oligoflexia bacterium]|nr:DUF3015 family protein [Oligoflexia bacterium]